MTHRARSAFPVATLAALAAVAALGVNSSVHARSEAELLRCLDLPDNAQRLACYDQAARALREARASGQAAPAAATAAAPAPVAGPSVQNFGRSAQAVAPQQLDARIKGEFSGWNKNDRVTLDNGQTWQMVDAGTVFAPLQNPKVTIKPGAFGASYFMQVEGLNIQIRVKRLQ